MKRIKLLLLLIVASFSIPLCAIAADNVKWSVSVSPTSDTEGTIIVKAEVNKGIHFYALAPDGGFNPTEINIQAQPGLEVWAPVPSVKPTAKYEPDFDMTISSWYKNVDFSIPYRITDTKSHSVEINIRFQACNETSCFAPKKEQLTVTLGDPEVLAKLTPADSNPASPVAEPAQAADNQEISADDSSDDNPMAISEATDNEGWWAPVQTKMPTTGKSPWSIIIVGFLGGLAAMLTPCVWPLIPMTLSFFLKKNKKSKFNFDALIYGISIVVIFLVLGMLITAIFGAGKLNELSTSALFNIIFFAILIVFAISFFGAFDIKLPKRWSNAMDNKAETTTGLISIFFMAFTLVLVSFSCTGPIIGTLLVEAASQKDIMGPLLGMGAFAIGLSLPFTLFALFPGMLKEMPKSGGWLNSVKVVLGFIELILSLKFLSVADLAYGWRILDREVFICLWIVLFVLLGMYLLGKIRFPHDSKTEHVSVGRFFLAIFPLSFAVYLLPGLWGAPLKAISAFAPPLSTQDFNLYIHDNQYVEFDDYDEAMKYAQANNMPVLVDFSGYGCVNCRNMEAAVLDTDQVRDYISDNFVMVKLMVDDRQKLSEPFIINKDGKTHKLETVGEKWTYLQDHKFGASSQPYYIVLDNEGRPMNDPVFYDNNVNNFMKWMRTGVAKYKSEN